MRQGKNTDLTYLRVYNAGHLVPMDQPEVALELINQFMADTLRNSDSSLSSSSDVNVEVITISFGVSALTALWCIGCGVMLVVAVWAYYCRKSSSSLTTTDGKIVIV